MQNLEVFPSCQSAGSRSIRIFFWKKTNSIRGRPNPEKGATQHHLQFNPSCLLSCLALEDSAKGSVVPTNVKPRALVRKQTANMTAALLGGGLRGRELVDIFAGDIRGGDGLASHIKVELGSRFRVKLGAVQNNNTTRESRQKAPARIPASWCRCTDPEFVGGLGDLGFLDFQKHLARISAACVWSDHLIAQPVQRWSSRPLPALSLMGVGVFLQRHDDV